MPFMECFDTTYPINTLVWILLWVCFGGISVSKNNEENKKNSNKKEEE